MQSDVAAFSVFRDIYMQRHWPLAKEKKKKVLWQAINYQYLYKVY